MVQKKFIIIIEEKDENIMLAILITLQNSRVKKKS